MRRLPSAPVAAVANTNLFRTASRAGADVASETGMVLRSESENIFS